MTINEFLETYLDFLKSGQAYDIYGYKKAGILKYLQTADAQAVNIIEMRAAKTQMSSERCHKALRSEYLWQLTTNGGARFLYFRDGPRRLVIVGASFKVKEKKFHIEIDRADKLRAEYLQLKEGMVT